MKITDILFITLSGICIYLIVNTLIEKKVLNFNNLIENNKNEIKSNKKLVEKKSKKKSSTSVNVDETSYSESANSSNSSQHNENYDEEYDEEYDNFIIESKEEEVEIPNQITKENFISENTEDLIDEVINQKDTSNQIVLNN